MLVKWKFLLIKLIFKFSNVLRFLVDLNILRIHCFISFWISVIKFWIVRIVVCIFVMKLIKSDTVLRILFIYVSSSSSPTFTDLAMNSKVKSSVFDWPFAIRSVWVESSNCKWEISKVVLSLIFKFLNGFELASSPSSTWSSGPTSIWKSCNFWFSTISFCKKIVPITNDSKNFFRILPSFLSFLLSFSLCSFIYCFKIWISFPFPTSLISSSLVLSVIFSWVFSHLRWLTSLISTLSVLFHSSEFLLDQSFIFTLIKIFINFIELCFLFVIFNHCPNSFEVFCWILP